MRLVMLVVAATGMVATPPVARAGSRLDDPAFLAPATDRHVASSRGPGTPRRLACDADDIPAERRDHIAIWTGTEMIIWGGYTPGYGTVAEGALYDPARGSWRPISTASAPAPRDAASAVWTGTEVIVWGGVDYPTYLATGGRYDPAQNLWRPTSTGTGTPSGRAGHSAVWTGTEMIVWGGVDPGYRRTGGRYDPASDTWVPTSLTAAPGNRSGHTAVFTGSEMIVWGGDVFGVEANTGGIYDVATDTWRPTPVTTAPAERSMHTAVWTGSEMIVWGGVNGTGALSGGGRLDPLTGTWSPTSQGARCPSARSRHTSVWTGTEMIVWGGYPVPSFGGGRYDPATDAWSVVSTAGPAPDAREGHSAVWTGTEMIVWGGVYGGYHDTGGRYDPGSDAWSLVPGSAATPPIHGGYSAAWTGTVMIVWGGSIVTTEGGRYDPVTGLWSPIATAPLAGTAVQSAVWTGTEMIVWGGYLSAGSYTNAGARYDPVLDRWTPTSTGPGTPSPRFGNSAVWTGTEMIVWGGYDGQAYADGGRYDPATDSWRPTSSSGRPSARTQHVSAFTGTEMIVWGGWNGTFTATGGLYDPAADSWRPLTPPGGEPVARANATAVWTGARMIVWGGSGSSGNALGTGGSYDPVADVWQPLPAVASSPTPRRDHSAVWTGTEMIIWGGGQGLGLDTGGVYTEATATWRPTSMVDAPGPRHEHAAVWTGREMIVFAGDGYVDATTRRYEPDRDRWRCGRSPAGLDVVAGKAVASAGSPGASIRVYDVAGRLGLDVQDAFPTLQLAGVSATGGDAIAGGEDEILASPGPVPTHPPNVRGFSSTGAPLAALDFLAYSAPGYGAGVATGRIDPAVRIVTGPGPSPIYGPHVRAFGVVGGGAVPLARVSFFAYGTLRFGVHARSGDLDRDGYDEILTGPGSGPPFGPHVRAFDYDGVGLRAIAKVNFYAYGSLQYGAEVGCGDLDGDGFHEILTGPGPSAAFPAHGRGFDYDGLVVLALPGASAILFPGSLFGVNVAGGDLDSDGRDDLLAGAGPDPLFPSRMRAFAYDGSSLRLLPPLDIDPFGTTYGVRVGSGDLGY